MIKNIVFDIGNVLAGFHWQDYFHSFGYSDEVFEQLADATVRSSLWSEMDRGKMSDEELIAGFIANNPAVEKEIREIYANMRGMIVRYDYAKPWLRELKERGYGIYVISNFGETAFKECSGALDFLSETDGAIISWQVKLIKPDQEIYRLLCSQYGLDKKECVFIDDTAKNVEAAREAGMEGIVFHNLAQAKEELEAMLR
ncbi:MAG: HAD family phosphatase [Clostridium sp.]|nr:HAD family phosphatase [Clostridium sp.]